MIAMTTLVTGFPFLAPTAVFLGLNWPLALALAI